MLFPFVSWRNLRNLRNDNKQDVCQSLPDYGYLEYFVSENIYFFLA